MSDRSSNVECPDCGQMVLGKNIRRHYRRNHPGLDPAKRLKETKERRRVRRSPLDVPTPRAYMVAGSVLVVIILVIAGLIVYGALHGNDGSPDTEKVRYTSSDGAIINGTFYPSGTPGAYTIYLFHDLGEDRSVWDGFARFLRDDGGYNVIAVDLRGHGTSVNNVKTPDIRYDYRTMNDQDFLKMKEDIVGAQRWVTNESNTDAGSEGAVVMVGKLGAVLFNQAARMAAQWGIDSGIYVDPVREAYGIETVQASEDWGDVRPIMLLSSDGDSEVQLALQRIADNRPENSVTVTVPGNDRGAKLFEDDAARQTALVTFQNGFRIADA